MEFGAGIEDVESPVRSDRVRVQWVQVRRSLPYPFPWIPDPLTVNLHPDRTHQCNNDGLLPGRGKFAVKVDKAGGAATDPS